MDYLLIDGKGLKNEIHTVLRTVMRAGVADKITEDIIEVIGGKTIDSGDLGDLMLNADEIDAVTTTEVCGMLLAGAICLIGVGIITLFWTKVEYENQLPDWKKHCKK